MPEAILPSYNIFSRFFIAWYFKLGFNLYSFFNQLVFDANYLLAPFTMLKFLFVPLFGDYTWQGVIIGIIFRLARAVVGLIALFGLMILSVLALAIWYALPLVAIFFAARNLVMFFLI